MTTVLYVDNYSGTSLIVPPSVTKLDCSCNDLTELISVTKLSCENNELIVSLQVTWLNCSDNEFTELIVPSTVTWLNCSYNQLTELIIPPTVTTLYWSGNQLTKRLLLIRGKLSPIRKRIAVRKAVRRMRKQFYRRKENVLHEITSRPSGTVGAWDKGGNIYQEKMEEAFNV